MAIPPEFSDEGEATATPLDSVASTTGTASTVIVAGTDNALADGTNLTAAVSGANTGAAQAAAAAAGTTTLTILADGTNATLAALVVDTNNTLATPAIDAIASSTVGTVMTLTTMTAENHADVPRAVVSEPFVTSSTSHDLDTQEHMIAAQRVLAFNEFPVEHHNTVTQESPREPRARRLDEAQTAVVPTQLNTIPELNRIRDRRRGITQRSINNGFPSLSSSSEDSESSSSDEGAVGGISKEAHDRLVKKKVSKDQLFLGKAVDRWSFVCKICLDRFCDSVYIPCGHLGCRPCIETWLQSSNPSNICHICRQIVESVHTPIILVDSSLEKVFTNYHL